MPTWKRPPRPVDRLREVTGPIVLVTNEVGMGIVP